MLSSGVLLSGRYRLDERVATGGMGDVWQASDLTLGRPVAVKILLPALVSDQGFIARFRAEARMMAALRHPGIVQVYDCGEDELPDGVRADYLVMEFVQGQPLTKRIEATGGLGVAETMSIVAQAADALHAAHLAGIVHRDVKPSNLLVQEDGTVVLVDFGVARSVDMTSITSTNAVPGTALYMAPEQASGRPVSAATDVYALGAVTYCCLTGSPPFTGDNPLQVAVRHLDDEPPTLPEEIPAPVAALVAQALAKDPADRQPTAAAMAEAARAAMAGLAGDTGAVDGPSGAGTAVVVPGKARPGLRDADTRNDLPVVPAIARSLGRHGRRGTLIGAASAVLVAMAGLVAALAFTPDQVQPATKLPAPGATTSAEAEPMVSGGGTDDPDQPDTGRGGSSGRPSADPSLTPTPPPSPTAAPESPNAPPTGPPPATPPTTPSEPTTTTPPPGEETTTAPPPDVQQD